MEITSQKISKMFTRLESLIEHVCIPATSTLTVMPEAIIANNTKNASIASLQGNSKIEGLAVYSEGVLPQASTPSLSLMDNAKITKAAIITGNSPNAKELMMQAMQDMERNQATHVLIAIGMKLVFRGIL